MRDIALTAFILGLLPVVLFRPAVGILLWTWIGLMNPHKLTWGFAYNFQFALIVGLVTIFAILISKEPKRIPLASPVVVLALFAIWMTVTTIFSLYPSEAWPKWDKVMKIQLFIFLTMMVMQSEQRIKALVLVGTLSIAYFGIKGGVYTIRSGGGGMVLGPDGGFISGNTEIALALTVTLPLVRWLQLQTERRWLRNVAWVAMALIAVSVLGSYSRGGLLAIGAMGLALWFKSRQKMSLGIVLAGVVFALSAFMPEEWYGKMRTIQTYEEDHSAQGRLGAWRFAWNLAVARPVIGGGFDTFQREAYAKYSPDNPRALDPHSIWFQILGEQGFVGLALFVLLWVLAWRTGARVIRLCRKRPDLLWARDLAAMIQVAFVGYWVGGAFLGLAYWDYPYLLVAVLVLTRVVVAKRLKESKVPEPSASNMPGPRLRTQER
jgi:probable O-glycosylation ligase (exosortase A-associated)